MGGMRVRCIGGWQDVLEAYEVLGRPIECHGGELELL
jgi:hypothetical protein